MPCEPTEKQPHRDKMAPRVFPFSAAVARPVGKQEILVTPAALEAMKKEWDRLVAQKVLDLSSVREWDDVAMEARDNGVNVQFGYIFGICVEKNSELKEGHPNRKFKGRVVFQGNRVVNQNWETALFQDLGSSPATLDAARAADAYGCFDGNEVEIADAVQAYIQAVLKGDACWVCLPEEARPPEWKHKFRKPVVRLVRALYGHPDSGTMWEQHCDAAVTKQGFVPIGPEWPSVYWNEATKILLVIYVDDFKMAGPKGSLKSCWASLRIGLDIEPESKLGMYLGCSCEKGTITLPDGKIAHCVTYNMEDFLDQCVQRYLVATKSNERLKKADTPFLPEDQKLSLAGAPHCSGPGVECPWCKHTFPMPNIIAGKEIQVSEHQIIPPTIDTNQGALALHASAVLGKVLYGARLARFDLLRAVASLACHVQRWTVDCDRRLHRLMCYINTTKHLRMIGWVGDSPDLLRTHLFSDADFAGCFDSQR